MNIQERSNHILNSNTLEDKVLQPKHSMIFRELSTKNQTVTGRRPLMTDLHRQRTSNRAITAASTVTKQSLCSLFWGLFIFNKYPKATEEALSKL